MLSREQTLALGVIWVGGWGFLFFNYPSAICKIMKHEAAPTRLRLIRIVGAIGLAVTFCSALADFIMGFFQN